MTPSQYEMLSQNFPKHTLRNRNLYSATEILREKNTNRRLKIWDYFHPWVFVVGWGHEIGTSFDDFFAGKSVLFQRKI